MFNIYCTQFKMFNIYCTQFKMFNIYCTQFKMFNIYCIQFKMFIGVKSNIYLASLNNKVWIQKIK
jgi:hypothetical protein